MADLIAIGPGHAIARIPRPRNGHARPGAAAPTLRDAVAAAEARFAAATGPDDRAAGVDALLAVRRELRAGGAFSLARTPSATRSPARAFG